MIINKEEYIKQLYERNVDRIYKICFIFSFKRIILFIVQNMQAVNGQAGRK